MEVIKINFSFFWPGFDKQNNWFTYFLSKKYIVEISDEPELYFFTHSYNGQHEFLKYKCCRVFLGWENARANWNICDYVLDSDYILNNPRHFRFPLWCSINSHELIKSSSFSSSIKKSKFCCIVVSNPHAKERIAFFKKLSAYKKVDSGGRFMNNIGQPVKDKLEFIKDYKFVISFENSSYPGYTTEKLVEPMRVGSIPIYWGDELVGKDFNTNSFINVNDFNSYDEVIEKIIELDNDDEKYYQMLQEPWLINNKMPDELSTQNFTDFFDFVVKDSKSKTPVGKSFLKNLGFLLNNKKINGIFMITQFFKKIFLFSSNVFTKSDKIV